MTQFISVRFGTSPRTYTYRNDGPRVGPGEVVRVPPARPGEGWSEVTVIDATCPEPSFACKAILDWRQGDAPPAPVPGHNEGDDGEGLDAIAARAEAFAEGAERWQAAGVNAETASAARDFIAGAKLVVKKAEAQRRAEKIPHEDAARAVDRRWKPVTDRLSRAADAVAALLESHLKAEYDRREAPVEPVRVESLTGQARAASLRTERRARVTDPNRAFMALMRTHHAEALRSEIERLANLQLRSTGEALPGCEIVETQKLHA